MATTTDVTVPLLDLRAQYAKIRHEIEPVVQEVLETQVFIGGPKVAALEARCAEYLQMPHAVGCSNGSDAIILALDALGIGPGDEVIVPTFTFFSTAAQPMRSNAVDIAPIFSKTSLGALTARVVVHARALMISRLASSFVSSSSSSSK